MNLTQLHKQFVTREKCIAYLEFFKEMTDGIIWTRPRDGYVRDDGSHLTEDAPIFVIRMQKYGLIEEWDLGMHDY